MARLILLCCLLIVVSCGAALTEEAGRERLLLGFEADEIERLAKEKTELKRKAGNSSEGVEPERYLETACRVA